MSKYTVRYWINDVCAGHITHVMLEAKFSKDMVLDLVRSQDVVSKLVAVHPVLTQKLGPGVFEWSVSAQKWMTQIIVGGHAGRYLTATRSPLRIYHRSQSQGIIRYCNQQHRHSSLANLAAFT